MEIVLPSCWRLGCAGRVLLCAAGCLIVATKLEAQVIIDGNLQLIPGRINVLGAAALGSDGFTVKKVPTEIASAMEEFDRYSGKGEWEKAFSTMPVVEDSPLGGLVAAGEGFYLPMRARYRQLLVGLSPAGREAYRVFNDAPARQGLAQLSEFADPTGPATPDEMARLVELFDKYFITSVGDQIGDRLGDAKFESGDFSGAAECWAAILRDFPDTTLLPMRLHVKRAIALARARRWDDYTSAAAFIREKYPTESIRLGGRDMPVRSVLDELATSIPATGASPQRVERADAADLGLPLTDEPLWQCVFADDTHLSEAERLFRISGMSGSSLSPAMISPRVWADDRRIYLNWFGIFMAIDVQTGKLVFRSRSFTDLPASLQQVTQLGVDPSADQAILPIAGADRVLVMSPSLASQQVVRAVGGVLVRAGAGQIVCYSTTDFKEVWKSSASGLATWTLLGTPLLEDQILYATARPLTTTSGTASTAMDMYLLAIDAGNGRLLWTLPLGTMSPSANVRGIAALPKPVMQKVRDVLYVQTGDSAVVAVNLQAKRVEWAYSWGKPAQAPAAAGGQPNGATSFRTVYRQADPLQCPTSIAFSEAGLFVKDRNSNMLHAIDVNGPSLKWSRPVETSSSIVGVDENSVYLLGRDLDCIDVRTKELRWSSKTPGVNGAVEPLAVGSHLYVFGARGVYDLDLTNGDPRIFYGYDRESYGGSIRRVGDRLICVSNRSVTAYPLPEK